MQNNFKAAFHTLGCKLNFSETSTIARQLQESGFDRVGFNEKADIYVINTCSVTENADRECRLIVNRALAQNPEAFIAITGCYAQLKPNDIAGIPGVDLVLGAKEKFNLTHYLENINKKETAVVMACEIDEVNHFEPSFSMSDRTRAFLKVQDGCDYNCSFCTIPLARGASRSDSIGHVLARIKELSASGIREVVLTGVNLGDFGKENPNMQRASNFTDLAKAIEEMDLDIRIRISSIEPNLLNRSIIDLVAASKKFMPHFHIPLQSGSDRILKLMKRRYLTGLYAERISYIKNVIPDCCIGADVITGFPGESENDFLETCCFIESLDISYLHVFTYSERDNTPAASMPDTVGHGERKRRNKMLRILSEKKLKAFYNLQKGKVGNVLFESMDKDGMMTGYTGNYVKVRAPYNPQLERTIQPVLLSATDDAGNFIYETAETLFVH
jgi:threonylcarbamoyladenosine tRNA methylthiotransferase MtaB